jgi:hypothetical protein
VICEAKPVLGQDRPGRRHVDTASRSHEPEEAARFDGAAILPRVAGRGHGLRRDEVSVMFVKRRLVRPGERSGVRLQADAAGKDQRASAPEDGNHPPSVGPLDELRAPARWSVRRTGLIVAALLAYRLAARWRSAKMQELRGIPAVF